MLPKHAAAKKSSTNTVKVKAAPIPSSQRTPSGSTKAKVIPKSTPKPTAKKTTKTTAKAMPKLSPKAAPKAAPKATPKPSQNVAAKATATKSTKKSPPLKTKMSPTPKGKKASQSASSPTPQPSPATKTTTTTAPKATTPPLNAASRQAGTTSDAGVQKKLLKKGHGVVDEHSGKVDSCHIYEANGDVYQCTLNQTNISANNNKFYIIQLLQEDSGNGCYVFTRWGRVGVPGQKKLEPFRDTNEAIASFCKKFHDKTGNHWSDRSDFEKLPGRYYLMDIDYGANDGNEGDKANETDNQKAKRVKPEVPPSALPEAVQGLMKLITSIDMMTHTMHELEIDTRRMPLGKISKPQILKAFGILKELETELKKPQPNVEEQSALFYTLIPHDFGFRKPPLINSVVMLKQKMDLLETLGELEIAARLLEMPQSNPINPLDSAYDSLYCKLEPLPSSHSDYARIVEYARNTQGRTHTSCSVTVEEVFRVEREGEEKRYDKFTKLENRQMLWHGSRLTNFMGILSQGLRIAPPEAPATGYMFGKGVYFADVCSKSANYCHPSRDSGAGLMLLCEAALGKQREYTNAQYMERPEKGWHSTKGVGRLYPDPSGNEVVDGVLWPKGKMMEDNAMKTSLVYPEHIIYDVAQCRIRFLVRMKFRFH